MSDMREPSMSHAFPKGVAIVIGGSGGVGRAVCGRFAEMGLDVALTYRSNAKAADEVAEAVRAHGRSAQTHRVNLADAENVHAFVEAVAGGANAPGGEGGEGIHTVVFAAGSDIPMRF